MGINDEYSRDAYDYELAYDSEESVESPEPLHPEDWQDWYSEQLLDAWMTIRNFSQEQYLRIKCGYPDFVDFVMSPSAERIPRQIDIVVWNLIKDIQVIREHVTLQQFSAWMEINIKDYST
jgi:hypothetical protein